MSEQIAAGDVVSLKSGSLPMTVGNIANVHGVEMASVFWSDAKQEQHSEKYPVAALKKIR